jgi:hypothetical protein
MAPARAGRSNGNQRQLPGGPDKRKHQLIFNNDDHFQKPFIVVISTASSHAGQSLCLRPMMSCGQCGGGR